MLVNGKLKICLIQADSINVPLQTENFVNRDKIVQYNTDSYLFNICSCLFIFVLLFLLFFFIFFVWNVSPITLHWHDVMSLMAS
jgi:hypothetical protein